MKKDNFENVKIFVEDENGKKYELYVTDVKKVVEEKYNFKEKDELDFEFGENFRQGRGSQRTLYLSREVSDFLDELCEKHNLKASNVVNRIMEAYIRGRY